MTIEEAYNKGLDDAEIIIINNLTKMLKNEKSDKFNNPDLEKIRLALKIQLKWFHDIASKKTSNVGKYAKIEIEKSLEVLTSQ